MKIQHYALIALLFLLSCKKDSTVTNTPAPVKSSEKKITSFKFSSTKPEAIGIIDENAKKITINVPYGTVVTSIQTVISVSDKATVDNTAPADFSKVVIYKVTAEDGTTQDYQVTTTISSPKFTIDTYTGPTDLEAGNGYFLLKGKGFGTDASKAQVILTNNTTSLKTTISTPSLVNDISIGLTIPETLALGTYSVQVVVNGETVPVPNTLNIIQAAPIIESLSSSSLAQSETLTINGRFFATGNTLAITFKSKTNGAIYTINYPNTHILGATATKIDIKVESIPGGTYTVQVNSNGKTSALKDVEVIAPVVYKPTIVKIYRSSNASAYSFYTSDIIQLLVQYVGSTPTPTVRFVSLTSSSTYIRSSWITYQGMDGSDVKCQLDSSLPKGSYRIVIESNGKFSDESGDIIQII